MCEKQQEKVIGHTLDVNQGIANVSQIYSRLSVVLYLFITSAKVLRKPL